MGSSRDTENYQWFAKNAAYNSGVLLLINQNNLQELNAVLVLLHLADLLKDNMKKLEKIMPEKMNLLFFALSKINPLTQEAIDSTIAESEKEKTAPQAKMS